jgi:cyanophycin synthetase
MRFTGIRALPGPNVYMYRPALHATLELDDLAEKESTDFPGFTERLLTVLPGLRDHHCSKGYPGGFVERLEEGTYFGHIVEHVCIELTVLAGVPVRHGKTRQADAPGRYWVIVEYQAEQATRFLLEVARELVEAVLANRDYPLAQKIAEAKRIVGRTELGPSTRAIADAATKRGIPWYRLDEGSLIQLGYGCKRKLVQATETQFTCSVAVDIAGDKERT